MLDINFFVIDADLTPLNIPHHITALNPSLPYILLPSSFYYWLNWSTSQIFYRHPPKRTRHYRHGFSQYSVTRYQHQSFPTYAKRKTDGEGKEAMLRCLFIESKTFEVDLDLEGINKGLYDPEDGRAASWWMLVWACFISSLGKYYQPSG